MTATDRFLALTPEEQQHVHAALCGEALESWTAFITAEGPIEYSDSIVGLWHRVDADLPADAYLSAVAGADLAHVDDRYSEPITAMQDDDLGFSGGIDLAYYSVYNLFRRYACGVSVDPLVIVKQALGGTCPAEAHEARLARAVEEAKGGSPSASTQ